MADEREMLIITKAIMFDLINIFESDPAKESYTPEEIKAIIRKYVKETTK